MYDDIATVIENMHSEDMSIPQKSWIKSLKIVLIAIGIYYLLYFIFFSLEYSPNCSLNGNYWDFIYWFADLGRFSCAMVGAGVVVLTPITIFLATNTLFSAIGLIEWVIVTSVYVLIFFVVYKLLIQTRRKKTNKRTKK